jgi:6-phosphofructokinase 1
VTDDFVRYARPLIGEDFVHVPMVGGLMRFARLKPIYAPKLLPGYLPQGYRK